MSESFLDGKVTLWAGDCLDVLTYLEENSIDSCCCDPPYHLTSIVKRFGGANAAPAKFGTDGAYARASKGFMSKTWDGGDVAFRPETWAAVYRVLKPGAHLLAFGGTRTYHRLACAIEDAGFEIRDTVSWLYGSGFPKSHDVSKGIDRAAGAERDVLGQDRNFGKSRLADGKNAFGDYAGTWDITTPATDAARQWEGWGTALKPAAELIVLARKPLSEGTVAANVLRWGAGAINVDGCRVGTGENEPQFRSASPSGVGHGKNCYGTRDGQEANYTEGRWPANLCHDGSDEVVGAFPESGGQGGCINGTEPSDPDGDGAWGFKRVAFDARRDSGSAARFFYTAKADADDRLGSKHPTVKPLDLMQYLVRLVTPPKGTCIDPFSGTGTTGEAAFREGMSAVLIEREAEYQEDIRRRMKLCLAGPDERARESIKARMKDKPIDHGPLFGGT
jgi:DNA modification methylase